MLSQCVSTTSKHLPLHRGSYRSGFLESSTNRWHLSMHKVKDKLITNSLAECETSYQEWLPFFFDRREFKRTQFQFLRSEPGSGGKNQMFHQDNSKRGLTFLIPLVDVPLIRGPTQLLLSTHRLTGSALQSASVLNSAASSISNVASTVSIHAPTLEAGDVLVYDSRTLHRGLKNRDVEGRPTLILRYDEVGSEPPGHGAFSTTIFRGIGNVLAMLTK